MVHSIKKLIIFAPEIMHYHNSLAIFLEKNKKVICTCYATRKKNFQYEISKSNKNEYLNIFLIIKIIKANKNFFICGNNTFKHIFIIFLLNYIFKKNYYLVSDSHHFIKKKTINFFFKYLFFKFFMGNVNSIIVPGIQSMHYLKNFFPNKFFHFFANYPFDFKKVRRNIAKKNKKYLKILIISRWVEEKNLNFTLHGLNKFIEKSNEKKIILNIVTDKSRSFILNNYKLNKEISLNVYRKLKRKNIYTLLKKNHLLILLSKFEPWGIVVEESGMVSLPSIISNRCGAMDLTNKNYLGVCNLKLKNFVNLLEKFSKDLFKLKNVSRWIVKPRDLKTINKNVNQFIFTLC